VPTPRQGPRQARREDVAARILEIGRLHLAEHGAPALSLRAVTRDLGMVSSAVYRYVANRDELLTLLLVDAYTELADRVDAALAASRGGLEPRFLALARAVRRWALDEPARYALLYGSPVPGYAAPAEQTTEPGTRVIRAILGLVEAGVAAGEVTPGPTTVPVPRVVAVDLRRVRADLGLAVGEAVLARAVLVWSALFGAVSLEVFGQHGPGTFAHEEALFEHQMRLVVATLKG
jgi:AcrR family transcriptional regulator